MHIKNIINEYLISNWRRDLLNIGLIVGICAFFFTLFKLPGLALVCIVVVLVVTSRMFWKLGNPSSAIQYLTIPASTAEKWLGNILIVNVYVVLLTFAAAVIGSSAGYFVRPLLIDETYSLSEPYMAWIRDLSGSTILTFFTWISVFFFGSVYFRKKAAVKTCLTIGVGFIALFILVLTTLLINIGPHGM
ncbi:MAG: hypothetical protein II894_01385, partial [Bacteroidales bacterium]|nr:hypothetical protein [Bacteroidales bacterium]